MTAPQLMTYRLVIVPGGNFTHMSASLTPQTTARMHDAVQLGVNYLGICAGAFLAADGRGNYNSFYLQAALNSNLASALLIECS
jgi:glutamine amidotransferase-like uncharacterized protein